MAQHVSEFKIYLESIAEAKSLPTVVIQENGDEAEEREKELEDEAGKENNMDRPPTPTSVPVIAPFTSEDTVKLAALTERKEDDVSLVVHVDDTQNDLDSDILDKAREEVLGEEKSEDSAGGSAAAAEGNIGEGITDSIGPGDAMSEDSSEKGNESKESGSLVKDTVKEKEPGQDNKAKEGLDPSRLVCSRRQSGSMFYLARG